MPPSSPGSQRRRARGSGSTRSPSCSSSGTCTTTYPTWGPCGTARSSSALWQPPSSPSTSGPTQRWWVLHTPLNFPLLVCPFTIKAAVIPPGERSGRRSGFSHRGVQGLRWRLWDEPEPVGVLQRGLQDVSDQPPRQEIRLRLHEGPDHGQHVHDPRQQADARHRHAAGGTGVPQVQNLPVVNPSCIRLFCSAGFTGALHQDSAEGVPVQHPGRRHGAPAGCGRPPRSE